MTQKFVDEARKKAVGVLAHLSADEKARMKAEDREKWIRDQMSRERGAREEGRVERGREIARLMLAESYPLSEVSKLTGLDESELRRLQ